MKRILASLLSAIYLFAFSFSVSAEEEIFTFYISIYDKLSQEYILENQECSTAQGITLGDSMTVLRENGLISGFAKNGDSLVKVSYYGEDKQIEELSSTQSEVFYLKLNGKILADSELYRQLHDGDILEWIYAEAPPHTASSATASSASEGEEKKTPSDTWNQKTASALDDACDWLNANEDASTLYLISIGTAGKTANVNMVNHLLNQLSDKKAKMNAQELAQNVIKLSFCGYDAANEHIASMLSKLMSYKDISQDSVISPIYTLLAYDCRNYSVPNSEVNSRKKLVERILSAQRFGGGFAPTPELPADADTTALAITALSHYKEEDSIKEAIDRALNYLQENKGPNGGFSDASGTENSLTTARVIVALTSASVELSDSRFQKGNKNLIDILLSYQQADGGFSHSLNSSGSDALSTENAVIALASVKKNSNPYLVSSTLQNLAVPSEQVEVQQIESTPLLYYIMGGVLVCLILAALIVLFWLRHTPKRKR